MSKHTILTVLAAALLSITPPAALAGATLTFDHAGPIVAGEHRYAGGHMELVPVSGGSMLALRIDGRQVALYLPEGGRSSLGAPARLVLANRGDQGQEIVALRDREGREVGLHLAASRTAPAALIVAETRVAKAR